MHESSNVEVRRCRALALVDLGMSDDKIGKYLAVDEGFVEIGCARNTESE